MEYAARGIGVVPVNANKRPLVKWKVWQTERPTDRDLRDWFERDDAHGLAVVTGKVSGGLTVRDFDDRDAFGAWATRHPAIAEALPIVETGRGFHVWFTSDATKTVKYPDGELRAGGAIAVCPPTWHRSGVRYSWLNPLPDGPIPTMDPTLFLPVNESECSECSECTQNTTSDYSDSSEHSDSRTIETVIAETLPTQAGERRHKLFNLARGLKFDLRMASSQPAELKAVVRQWHGKALPVIQTKNFDETWADFLAAWECAHTPLSADPVGNAFDGAKTEGTPTVAGQYDTPDVQRLVRACHILAHRAGDSPFYLSSHDAARRLGVPQPTAFRWLKMLVADGLLVAIEPGNRHRATRYRWTGSLQSAPDAPGRTDGTPTPCESSDAGTRASVRAVDAPQSRARGKSALCPVSVQTSPTHRSKP